MLASGVTISLHYCGGKFKRVSFLDTGNEDGCCGTKKKSKGCCNEKTTFVKVKDNHQSSDKVNLTFNVFKVLLDAVFPTQVFEIGNKTDSYFVSNYHAPPVLYDNPLYLKHRVLLI